MVASALCGLCTGNDPNSLRTFHTPPKVEKERTMNILQAALQTPNPRAEPLYVPRLFILQQCLTSTPEMFVE